MAAQTDHWSKMRMNIVKNSINVDHRGRVLSWNKHQKLSVQRELEAGIRGQRSLPEYNVGFVHNFQDILNYELNGYLPGSSYLRQRTGKIVLQPLDQEPRQILKNRLSSLSSSRYTLMTLPTDPQSDQTRSRIPVLQCRGKI